jgi:hypothetical protein
MAGEVSGAYQSDLTAMRNLQDENRRLRHLVAELSLDNAAYKEIQKGKW